MKACFCVRSIFCAIQSSWISAIAGVKTIFAVAAARGAQFRELSLVQERLSNSKDLNA